MQQGRIQRITPFLWFERNAEAAAEFYVTVFPDSRIRRLHRFSEEAARVSGKRPGEVMTVSFELEGQEFVALNGGPCFQINEAVSFVVNCRNQQEVDYYWDKLSDGGEEEAQRCGWLKDRYGVTWQVVPERLLELLDDPDPQRPERVMQALMSMKRIDIAALEQA